MQHRNTAFTREEAAASIRAWLEDDGDDDLAFRAYHNWVLKRIQDDATLEIPTHPQTFERLFGGWNQALDHAYPGAQQARERAQTRQADGTGCSPTWAKRLQSHNSEA